MVIQYIITALIVAAALTYAACRIKKMWKQSQRGNPACAGCPIADGCKSLKSCDKQQQMKNLQKKHTEKFAGNKNK